ncbi:MAG: hypothetical protein C0592_14650, partial [Marinilabiliales bacterium]
FAAIDWANGPYWIEVSLDGTLFGTSQLVSVPFALHSATADSLTGFSETDPVFGASIAAGITGTDTAYWNNKLDVELDGSNTNELQVLSISNDTIYLSDGGFAKLPAGFDGDYNSLSNKPDFTNWDTDVTDDFDGDYSSLTNAPTNVSAFTNDAGYLTSFTEAQILTISNDTVYLTGGSYVKLPAGFDGDYYSLTNLPDFTNWDTDVTDDFSGDYNDLSNLPTPFWSYNNPDIYMSDNTNRLGLGTSTPSSRLHVKMSNTSITGGIRLETSQATAEDWYFYMPANDNLHIRNDASDYVIFEMNTGNVGIGVIDPSTKLDVNGTFKIQNGTSVNEISTDGTMTGNSDDAVPTEQAVKTYVDNAVNTANPTYSIGDFAHGGIVFWVDATGQHGLVCAKQDIGGVYRWYAGTDGNTQAKADGPRAGAANTTIIIAAQVAIGDDGSTYAARICNELQITEGGISYCDWYLPSKEELALLYTNRAVIDATALANGGLAFMDQTYWSSTENLSNTAWTHYFLNGLQTDRAKNTNYYIRPVRSF